MSSSFLLGKGKTGILLICIQKRLRTICHFSSSISSDSTSDHPIPDLYSSPRLVGNNCYMSPLNIEYAQWIPFIRSLVSNFPDRPRAKMFT